MLNFEIKNLKWLSLTEISAKYISLLPETWGMASSTKSRMMWLGEVNCDCP